MEYCQLCHRPLPHTEPERRLCPGPAQVEEDAGVAVILGTLAGVAKAKAMRRRR